MTRGEVILAGTAHPYRGGGLASFNERLARAFSEMGYSVVIYNFSLQYPSFLFPGKTQYTDESPPEGLTIIRKINSINPFNWINVGLEIRKKKPALLVMRYWIPFMAPCLGTIARLARSNGFTKVIPITDNIIPHERRPFDKLLSRYFLNSCDAYIAMSKSVMEDISEFNKTKPRLYYPHPLYDNFGPPVTREQACNALNLDPSFRYLLFFGFIRDYKGLDILLQAFADPRFKDKPIRLLVAGEFYSDPLPYRKLIQELNIQSRMILHDQFISNAEVPLWFCAADLIVQPYKTATQSGVTQTAYFYDKPMIVTRVGGLAEMVADGEAGYVTNPDPIEIADAIERFFTDPNPGRFQNFVNSAKKQFSWEGMILAFVRLLSEIPESRD